VTISATASSSRVSPVELVLRVLAVAGLGVTAYIHLHLAHLYAANGSTISQGDLFVAQGVVSIIVGLALLATGGRWAWLLTALVSLASLAAVLVSRYTSLGSVGPLPNMHDASWEPSPDKLNSAIAEAAVVAVVLIWVALVARTRSRSD
jgi:hypothetical protein